MISNHRSREGHVLPFNSRSFHTLAAASNMFQRWKAIQVQQPVPTILPSTATDGWVEEVWHWSTQNPPEGPPIGAKEHGGGQPAVGKEINEKP